MDLNRKRLTALVILTLGKAGGGKTQENSIIHWGSLIKLDPLSVSGKVSDFRQQGVSLTTSSFRDRKHDGWVPVLNLNCMRTT